jgi:hypothetical protein
MTVSKWIAATAVLAMGLSAGVFVESEHWRRDRNDNEPVYSQRYSNYRDYAWNNNYRDGNREHNGAWENNYRDRARGGRDTSNRDHHNRRQDGGDRD